MKGFIKENVMKLILKCTIFAQLVMYVKINDFQPKGNSAYEPLLIFAVSSVIALVKGGRIYYKESEMCV